MTGVEMFSDHHSRATSAHQYGLISINLREEATWRLGQIGEDGPRPSLL